MSAPICDKCQAGLEHLGGQLWMCWPCGIRYREPYKCDYCGAEQKDDELGTFSSKGWMCDACIQAREKRRSRWAEERRNGTRKIKLNLQTQLNRARKAGLPATLTLDQWLDILKEHDWKCHYCKTRPYEAIEHRVPIYRGGGTTAENCVPSCRTCNLSKGVEAQPRQDLTDAPCDHLGLGLH